MTINLLKHDYVFIYQGAFNNVYTVVYMIESFLHDMKLSYKIVKFVEVAKDQKASYKDGKRFIGYVDCIQSIDDSKNCRYYAYA